MTAIHVIDSYIFTGGIDGKIRKWDTVSGHVIATFPGHAGSVTSILVDKKMLYSGASDQTIRGNLK